AARLDDSALRVLRLKEARGLFAATAVPPAQAARLVRTAGHRRTALDVATRAVTVVKNDKALPLHGGVHVTGPARFALTRALKKEGLRIVPAAAARTVLVTTSDAGPGTGRYLATLARRTTVVMVSTGNPYDLRYADAAQASVATYAAGPVSMRGLARVLSGHAPATGRLPLAIPGGPRAGTGLSY
ncbi:MAG: glycoside hydrolase family 3 C-terminal domain-containing protein, partial [Streptosporangiaceae bacterium]